MFAKVWAFLNGKKTVIGAVITAVGVVAGHLPVVLAFFGVDAVQVATIVGIVTAVLGVAHKLYKWVYHEDVK